MSNSSLARPSGSLRDVQLATPPASKVRTWLTALGGEVGLVFALILISLVAHSLNMLNSPGFAGIGDEGIYLSQAWAVIRQGALAPYTYFYDHAPAGWLLIAAWLSLTGGPHTFGGAIDSGRVLMLVLHLGMVPLLYQVARKLGCGAAAATIATLLFSLSPLAIYYQRLVLLDNIMMFWLLLSLNLMLDGWGRLSRLALSGIAFGLAVLSKETAIIFTPAVLYLVLQARWRHQGRFAISGWLLPMLVVVSWYPLFAALKGELMPAGQSVTFFLFGFGGQSESVSLVEALRWQAGRGGGGPLNLDNQFWQYLRQEWLTRDALILIAGSVATVINLVRGIRDRRALAAGLLAILPLLYLARGGIVLEFYILAVIPFLCLNVALLTAPVLARLPAFGQGVATTTTCLALILGYGLAGSLQPLYQDNPGQAARESITWIKRNLPADSRMVIHDDPWTDLREPGLGGPSFPNIHPHWKVAADPAVRDTVFHNDWQRVDYVLTLPGLESIYRETNNTVTLGALENGHLVKRWESDGDVVELWKVDQAGSTEAALLAGSDAYLKQRFEREGAYVAADGSVNSEGQSYALLRAVWSDDRAAFDRTWAWTRDHLRQPNGLLAWLWRDGAVVDSHAASDADTDTALALLLAGQRWNDPNLLEEGQALVRAIWEHEVTTVAGVPYLTAGNWTTGTPVIALNPSYFAPYAYQIFQEVDPEHDWQGVIDSGYQMLFAASELPLGGEQSAGLPPDWVGLDTATGALVPLDLDRENTTHYGYDAARTYWRIALHHQWNGDGRAAAYLSQTGFLRDEVNRKGTISAVYAHDGSIVEVAPSQVGLAGALATLLVSDQAAAHHLFAQEIVGTAERAETGVRWGNPQDRYAQEWGWFATALYANALPNLWDASEYESAS